MPKVLTVNEMIYKTLTTKETKVPKYKSVLEALGYELVKDHGWSHYDYWAIKIKEDNRILVISQGYDHKRHIYKTANLIKTNDIAKVDFVNLINTDRSANRWYNRRTETNIQRYKSAKQDYKIYLSICEDQRNKVKSLEEQLAKAREDVIRWEKYAENRKTNLDEAIATIKKGAGV
jgi:uncharacterized protein YegP (UPF0339 family)